ncbi:MAG: N-acetylglucosamine kinase [Ferruginibacter sp.]|nr:N-acetylglucosamine kinase [Bacteroidota bacterium]MBX2920021.1 N-acetylglucosamine kinase [Ferruginibacter sp.]MCB0710423.1 N-acetylglucosamine kinase [Chitinophagaceae bacterium]MCC7378393.1 N-acetylglucosamine kinase [Chitinophagaceae bacterium]
MAIKLIADSGSTKAEWCLINGKKTKTFYTQGLSPYFLSAEQIEYIINEELKPKMKNTEPDEIFFYGTGCSNADNVKLVKKAINKVFTNASVDVNHDLMGAAKALCGHEKGIACILGTGSNSCYYNGKKIVKNSPGLGYVLGDEGSGAYMGKKVVQHFLYKTFDEDLMDRFNAKYNTNSDEILTAVYKQPLPNRYLATFTEFLVENRGHYMIENIIEDSFNDFFFNHIYKYRESWTMPLNFTGSVAYGFRDVLKDLCNSYELNLGKVIKKPMDGLVKFHR